MDSYKMISKRTPLTGAVLGTKIVLEELADLFHCVEEEEIDKSLWQPAGQGYVYILDTGILGIHTFGIWLPSHQAWLSKKALQSCDIDFPENDSNEFIWTVGEYGHSVIYSFRFLDLRSAKLFIHQYKSCIQKTRLHHSISSDLSQEEWDISGLNNSTIINPRQRCLSPVQRKKIRSTEMATTSQTYLGSNDSTSCSKIIESLIPQPTIDNPFLQCNTSIQVVKNNLTTILDANNGLQVLVHITDSKKKDQDKTYIMNGKIRNRRDAIEIITRLRYGGYINGEVEIKNIPSQTFFESFLSRIIYYLASKFKVIPFLQVLEVEVIDENITINKKTGNIHTEHPTKEDYSYSLDFDDLYSKTEPYGKGTIDPEIFNNLCDSNHSVTPHFESITPLSSRSGSVMNVSPGGITDLECIPKITTQNFFDKLQQIEHKQVHTPHPSNYKKFNKVISTGHGLFINNNNENFISSVEELSQTSVSVNSLLSRTVSEGSIVNLYSTKAIALSETRKLHTVSMVKPKPDASDFGRRKEAEQFETGVNSTAFKKITTIAKGEKISQRKKTSFSQKVSTFFSNVFGNQRRKSNTTSKKITDQYTAAMYPDITQDEIHQAQYLQMFNGLAKNKGEQFTGNIPQSISSIEQSNVQVLKAKGDSHITEIHLYDEEIGRPKKLRGASNLLRNLRSSKSTSSFSESLDSST